MCVCVCTLSTHMRVWVPSAVKSHQIPLELEIPDAGVMWCGCLTQIQVFGRDSKSSLSSLDFVFVVGYQVDTTEKRSHHWENASIRLSVGKPVRAFPWLWIDMEGPSLLPPLGKCFLVVQESRLTKTNKETNKQYHHYSPPPKSLSWEKGV